MTVLREGYSAKDFGRDSVAGLTVAIVALPLAIALAIASGVHALKSLANRCKHLGSVLIISGVQPQPKKVLRQMLFIPAQGELEFADNFDEAIKMATEFTR